MVSIYDRVKIEAEAIIDSAVNECTDREELEDNRSFEYYIANIAPQRQELAQNIREYFNDDFTDEQMQWKEQFIQYASLHEPSYNDGRVYSESECDTILKEVLDCSVTNNPKLIDKLIIDAKNEFDIQVYLYYQFR